MVRLCSGPGPEVGHERGRIVVRHGLYPGLVDLLRNEARARMPVGVSMEFRERSVALTAIPGSTVWHGALGSAPTALR